MNMRFFCAPSRRVFAALTIGFALIACVTPAANAQTDFNNNGDVIGNVVGLARVGFAPVSPPITVTANAGTSVSGFLSVYNDSTLNMTGGFVNLILRAFDSSTVNLSGGLVRLSLNALDSSTVNMTGGNIGAGGSLVARNSSVVNLSGGSVGGGLIASDSGVVNFTGGSIGNDMLALDNGVINYSGGSVGDQLVARNSGAICIFGTGLSAAFNSFDGFYNLYTLSGFLLDGTDITGKELSIENNGTASFKLVNVPEPGVVAFSVIAAGSVLGLVARKRKK